MSLRWKIVLAFLALYGIWGSTYLAIRIAIETLPSFLMAGVRFTIAGSILYGWVRRRGEERPDIRHWAATTAVGAFLLLGGNGGVVWAEHRVPSGLAALLVSTTPLWMTLLDWARPGGRAPNAGVAVGVATGFLGVAALIGPGSLSPGYGVDLLGAGALIFASLSWSAGSVVARQVRLPESSLLATGMEMIGGGLLMILAGLAFGEASGFDPAGVSLRSFLAFAYLIVFGSLVGFTSFAWLLRVTTLARVSTYAYVNPVVAVFLGWALAGEPVTPRVLASAAVIIGSVVLITAGRSRETAARA